MIPLGTLPTLKHNLWPSRVVTGKETRHMLIGWFWATVRGWKIRVGWLLKVGYSWICLLGVTFHYGRCSPVSNKLGRFLNVTGSFSLWFEGFHHYHQFSCRSPLILIFLFVFLLAGQVGLSWVSLVIQVSRFWDVFHCGECMSFGLIFAFSLPWTA